MAFTGKCQFSSVIFGFVKPGLLQHFSGFFSFCLSLITSLSRRSHIASVAFRWVHDYLDWHCQFPITLFPEGISRWLMKLPDADPGPCWTSSGLLQRQEVWWESSHQVLRVFTDLHCFCCSWPYLIPQISLIAAWIHPEWPRWCKIQILCWSESGIFGIFIGMMWLKVGTMY